VVGAQPALVVGAAGDGEQVLAQGVLGAVQVEQRHQGAALRAGAGGFQPVQGAFVDAGLLLNLLSAELCGAAQVP
jgi:hypothetical protein